MLPNFSTHLLFIIFLSSTSHIPSHSSSTRYINQNLIELSSNRVRRMLWDIYHHIFKLKSEHQVLNQYFNFSNNRQWKTSDLFRRRPCWAVCKHKYILGRPRPDGDLTCEVTRYNQHQPSSIILLPPPQHWRTGDVREQSRSLMKVSEIFHGIVFEIYREN